MKDDHWGPSSPQGLAKCWQSCSQAAGGLDMQVYIPVQTNSMESMEYRENLWINRDTVCFLAHFTRPDRWCWACSWRLATCPWGRNGATMNACSGPDGWLIHHLNPLNHPIFFLMVKSITALDFFPKWRWAKIIQRHRGMTLHLHQSQLVCCPQVTCFSVDSGLLDLRCQGAYHHLLHLCSQGPSDGQHWRRSSQNLGLLTVFPQNFNSIVVSISRCFYILYIYRVSTGVCKCPNSWGFVSHHLEILEMTVSPMGWCKKLGPLPSPVRRGFSAEDALDQLTHLSGLIFRPVSLAYYQYLGGLIDGKYMVNMWSRVVNCG